jgi:uncharacterized RDD family membrane protein YckC
MKNLSSDSSYYRQIANSILLPAFFVFFVTEIFKDSPTSQVIFSCIGAALTSVIIIGLFQYKKITYNSDTVFIKNYFTGKVIEIPFSNIISIEKIRPYASYATIRTGRLIFSDGDQTQKVRFYLAYNLYSVPDIMNYVSLYIVQSPVFNTERILPYQAQIDRGKRIISAFTDHMIMTMIAMPFAIPEFIYQFTHKGVTEDLNTNPFPADNWGIYVVYLGFAFFFCKDCVNGQSPAKRLFKFQVVNNKTGEVAGSFRCFIRDIFMILWPIEVVILLINPARRLGDWVAGTRVVIAEPGLKPKINIAQLAIVLILAYPVMPVGMLAVDKLGRQIFPRNKSEANHID